MIEVKGNLWTYPADVRVITTNGSVKRNGEAVMGRGCAKEAALAFPQLPALLGFMLRETHNIPHILGVSHEFILATLPVKHEWAQKADLELIEASCRSLSAYADIDTSWQTIVMPRPGCGNGGLKWDDVRPVIEPILDDRFHVITF